MILYFSGTGNSKFIAEEINKVLKDSILSLNDLIKGRCYDKIESKNPFVVVCPTYAWRIPKVVYEYLEKVELLGNTNIYFVLTCGGNAHGARKYLEKLSLKKGMVMKGYSEILMPDNYIIMYNPSQDNEKAIKKIKEGKSKGESLGLYILEEKDFPQEKSDIFGPIKAGVVNELFYKFYISGNGFNVDDKCIGCNLCEKLCPLNNIKMVNNKPTWGSNCTQCLACISRCPKEAIEYKNKTKGRKRYNIEKLRGLQ